jgi:hypothetical protein
MKLKNTLQLLFGFFMILSLITLATATTSNYVWWNDNGDETTANRIITQDETLNVSFWADSIENDFPLHLVYTLRYNDNFHKFIQVDENTIFNGSVNYYTDKYGSSILDSNDFDQPGNYTIKLSSWDETGTGCPAQIHFTVLETGQTNQAPIAIDDSFDIQKNSVNNELNVLSNDYDPEDDDFVIINVQDPAHGTVTFNNDFIYYTPDQDFVGENTFTYTIEDSHDAQTIGTVSVTVLDESINQAPELIQNIQSQVIVDGESFNSFNLYDYFNDTDDATLDFDFVGFSDLDVNIDSDGDVFVDYDSIDVPINNTGNFIATDNINDAVESNEVTFAVKEIQQNQAPIAIDDSFDIQKNSVNNELNVLSNDYDPEDDDFVIINVQVPAHGTVTFNNDFIYYTPNQDFVGIDGFVYVIKDSFQNTDYAFVTVNVTEQSQENQPPALVNIIPSQVIVDGESFNSFNLYDYFNDLDNTTLDFGVLNVDDLNYDINSNGDVYVTYDSNQVPVVDSVVFTASDGVNEPVESNLVTFTVNEYIESNLFIQNFTCLDRPIPQSGIQACQVQVRDENQNNINNALVKVFYENNSLIKTCTTNLNGYCPINFNVSNNVGTYDIYATAQKQGYDFDLSTAPHVTFDVRYRRYVLDNFYIHNSSANFGNPFAQTLNFYRGEGIYVEFLIRDLDAPNQPIVTELLDSELILYNDDSYGGLLDFNLMQFNSSNGVYWYSLSEIPLNDLYLGENLVIGFVMNEQNQTADSIANINIFNNLPVWGELPVISLEENEVFTINLEEFANDLEDDYYSKTLDFNIYNTEQDIINYEINNQYLSIEALNQGSLNLNLRATDHNGGFTQKELLVNVEPAQIPLNAYFEVKDRVKTNTETLFNASKSTGNITKYIWKFNSNAQITPNPENYYTFNIVGYYDITLIVYDSEGNSDSYTKTIEVDKASACYDGLDNDGDGYVDMNDPSCIETNGRSEHSLSTDIESGLSFGYIDVYAGNDYYAHPGEDVFANIKIRNPTEEEINDLRLSLTIADLGIKLKSSKFDLVDKSSKTITMNAVIPYFAWEEEYPVKISVANDDLIHSTYRFITVKN